MIIISCNCYQSNLFEIKFVAGSSVKQQTDPPSIAIKLLYPDGNFPVGEEVQYNSNADR